MKKILFSILIIALIIVLCPAALAGEEQVNVTEVEVGIPIEEHPELFLTRSMPTHGEARIAVFLIEFPDHKNDNPTATKKYYDNIYFGTGNGVSWDGEKGCSVADFYREQSYGKLNISGEVFDWYTAEHERSYYDYKKPELIMEAAEYYRAQGVDFSEFDGDGDGVIDAATFHFAGGYSDSSDHPWYSGVEYENGGTPFGEIGGMKLTTLVQVAELSNGKLKLVPIICHELGHTLGLDDLYGKVKLGMNPTFDLMSKNNRTINPYFKILLGWIDTVKVITGDVSGFKLEQYQKFDSVAIVCNEFDGIFGEFYVVAYRELSNARSASVWHVDSRLNESGTAFMYNNLKCDPTPDVRTDHSIDNYSPYAFIEELSGDPAQNFLLGFPSVKEASFTDGGSLGPNSIPSSDTHDGCYTGIRMDNFVLHDLPVDNKDGIPIEEKDKSYITFDVSFVEDTEVPAMLTEDSELVFQNKITLTISESVYAGENWSDIKVTDLDGKPLDATVKIANYPRYQITVLFNDQSYKNGYKIILPDGCVSDSSGNGIMATTLTAKPLAYIFPLSETQLTSAEFVRNNAKAHFFVTEEGFDVLTYLWEYSPILQTNVPSAKLELMRFDRDGNEVDQIIVDNPIKNSDIEFVSRTDNGYYIIFCSEKGDNTLATNSAFCLDASGAVKWINEQYVGSSITFGGYRDSATFDVDGGVVATISDDKIEGPRNLSLVRIDTETGKILHFDNWFEETRLSNYDFFDIGDGRVLCIGGERSKLIGDMQCQFIRILNATTLEVIAENYFEASYLVEDVHANENGSFLLYATKGSDRSYALILDAALNTVKSVSWEKDYQHNEYIHWFYDEGFFLVNILEGGGLSHDNVKYHVRHYNKCLELVWETDIESNFFRFFMTSTGEIICYRSMWKPQRECYIDFYGSDAAFNPTHTHSIIHYEEKPVSCTETGHGEYWQCRDCGVLFSDEGKTAILDASGLVTVTPGEHSYGELKKTVDPTCETAGKMEGICTVCGETVTEEIPASENRHVYGDWITENKPTCISAGKRTRTCAVCGKTETKEISASDKNHVYEDWVTEKEPTCASAGFRVRSCTVCGEIKSEEIPASDKYHVTEDSPVEHSCIEDVVVVKICTVCDKEVKRYTVPASEKYHVIGDWITEKEPTCQANGTQTRSCTVCGKVIDSKRIPPSSQYHIAGEWEVKKAPTTNDYGEEILSCTVCGKTIDGRKIDKLPTEMTEEKTKEETEKNNENTGDSQAKQDEDKPADATDTSASGCDSSIGTEAFILVALILGYGLIFKKRES